MEINGLARAIISRNICAMKVFPPPDFARNSMLASPIEGS